MFFKNNSIHHLLKRWGKQATELPQHHEQMKATILQSLSTQSLPTVPPHAPKRLPWLVASAAGLTLVLLMVAYEKTPSSSVVSLQPIGNQPKDVYGLATSAGSATSEDRSFAPSFVSKLLREEKKYYHESETAIPISDTREFSKLSYGATIQTRRVHDLGARLTTLIRGVGGRVDQSSFNKNHGYIQFVIPKDEMKTFKDQLGFLVKPRFLTENSQSENRLPQKIYIEEETATNQTALSDLTEQLQTLKVQHTTSVAGFNRDIANIKNAIAARDEELKQYPERVEEITKQKTSLLENLRRIEARLRQENTNYTTNLSSIDNQIQYTKSRLQTLDKQNQFLIDDVETVSGSFSLQRINIWELFTLYFVDYWYTLFILIPMYVLFRNRPPVLRLPE